MPKTSFKIPEAEDLTKFFQESFGRDLSTQEQKIMNFFYHQMERAVLENMQKDRLNLCGTMIYMLSPQEKREGCLEEDFFGKNKKRSGLAKTIEAIFLQDTAALNGLIRQSNDELTQRASSSFAASEEDKLFDEVGKCRAEEKSAMKEFCTNYTIFLAKEIYSLFSLREEKKWQLGKLPIPHQLLNHPEDRLKMLGHRDGVVQGVEDAPPQAISNPQGYSLRSIGEKRKLEATR